MNEQAGTSAARTNAYDAPVVQQVLLCSVLLLGILVAVCWCLQDWSFARSILIGGLLVNGSLWLLKKDAQRLMQRGREADESVAAGINFEKTRFILRSFARLVVLGLLLFVLASQVPINVIGLTLGFATVMFSVVIIGLHTGKCWMPSKV